MFRKLMYVLQISQKALTTQSQGSVYDSKNMSSPFIVRLFHISLAKNCSVLRKFQCYEFPNLEHTYNYTILKLAELFLLFLI